MKKLKVAVGLQGRIAVLEKFPNDEEHAGLHEMLIDVEDNAEAAEPPGVYLATFRVEQTTPRDPSDVEAYLDFELQPIDQVSNVFDLGSARNIRDANVALDESIELLDQQAELKANFDLERKHAAALNPEITLGDEYDSKDIYLETFSSPHNVRSVVGLHAIGHAGQYDYSFSDLTGCTTQHSTDFQSIEVWGNEYDSMNEKEQVMIGRGSFRVHTHDIDAEAKQWEAEGWKRIPNPWKKK